MYVIQTSPARRRAATLTAIMFLALVPAAASAPSPVPSAAEPPEELPYDEVCCIYFPDTNTCICPGGIRGPRGAVLFGSVLDEL